MLVSEDYMRQGQKEKMYKVGIIMGSDSDLPIMQETAKVLEEFKVTFELTIVSAHRTPERLVSYARSAQKRGLQVIVAGAGGAAHLPGMIASLTPLPVIGVPIKTSMGAGVDSLFSIAQMPPGVPVATVAINGAKNAGILAAQIVGLSQGEILRRVERFKRDLKESVLKKATTLEKRGFAKYLKKHLS
jgi:5-(carboxyamino)imidazole ribonucleotide mutase